MNIIELNKPLFAQYVQLINYYLILTANNVKKVMYLMTKKLIHAYHAAKNLKIVINALLKVVLHVKQIMN